MRGQFHALIIACSNENIKRTKFPCTILEKTGIEKNGDYFPEDSE
jgi:hypothetical protein